MAPFADTGLKLALALVESSNAPLLLLDAGLLVTAASASFCLAFDLDKTAVIGVPIFDLGAGEWEDARLHSLLEATLAGTTEIAEYEFELRSVRQGTRRLLLHAHTLEYPEAETVRLLLAATDVTSARDADRERDALIRENAMLLQEVQHRIANSLQIIASVLMQSARKVQSEETRGHLTDAHNRVMSIATLQRHLAVTKTGDVALAPYLTQLCRSIAASMIRDPAALSIDVEAQPVTVAADVSVSIGLMVTELVINALKHAFPDGRHGKVVVRYAVDPQGWTLSVTDDGVGMDKEPLATAGLGTSIVHALARQLRARIDVTAGDPGTRVSIVHIDPSRAAANDPPLAAAV